MGRTSGIGEKGVSHQVQLISSLITITAVLFVVTNIPDLGVGKEYEVTNVWSVMKNWSIEGPVVYEGRRVTKITASEMEANVVYQSQIELTSPYFKGASMVIYATYVEGASLGFKVSWRGEQAPSEMIKGLDYPTATTEDVRLKVVYIEASSATFVSLIQDPYPNHVITINSKAQMDGWKFEGPITFRDMQVTKITADRILVENLLVIREGRYTWETFSPRAVLKDVLVYSVYTAGKSFDTTTSWRGHEAPPASLYLLKENLGLLGENDTFYDSMQHVVYVSVGEITLDNLKVSVY